MSKSNVTDMTVGSPIKHLLKFALPLLVGNLFQQLYNMVDSIVVGNYVGLDALAAVGNCSTPCYLAFSLSSGLAIGIGVVVAQYFGARDDQNVRVTIANSFYILIVVSLVVSLTGYFLTPMLFRLLKTPGKVLEYSIVYMRVNFLGIIGIAMYNGVFSILRALGDSRTPLYFLMVASVMNVVLDLIFVLTFHMDVFGVALATVISQVISAILCFFYAYTKVPYFQLRRKELKPNRKIIIISFKTGVPIALQNSIIAISGMVLQGFVNTFGENVMGAFTIVKRIEMIVHQPFTSLGAALTTFTGQNIGARKVNRVKKGFLQATIMALIFSLCLIPVVYLFGKPIAGLFVDKQEVINITYQALRISSLSYFALGMIYVPRSLLNGCGDTKFALVNGSCEVGCRIMFAPIFTSIPQLGYLGLWVTQVATWVTTAMVCVIRYFSGVWKKKGIGEDNQ